MAIVEVNDKDDLLSKTSFNATPSQLGIFLQIPETLGIFDGSVRALPIQQCFAVHTCHH